ncbi:MAG: WYL domain-containing protein [Actinobacteria bacterium]|nr:WYL domain-containing protein [Actinomycetota bacterium]
MERDQLAIDRLSRIWAIIEHIAENPGTSRRRLAERYALSERQVQEDLRVIREELRFPLVRHKGYRFSAGRDHVVLDFTFSEARALISALRLAALDRAVPQESLRSLLSKLPAVFPLHLQPLIRKSLESLGNPEPAIEERVFLALTEALFEKRPVRLHLSARAGGLAPDPIVEPHLLMPYLGSWYLVGRCRQKKRVMMFKVESIEAVTLASKM